MTGPPLAPGARVFVRLPSWLGDLVQSEPAVRALYGRCADAGTPERISLAAPRALLGAFDGLFPGARRVPLERADGDAPAHARGHDVALLLTSSFRSALAVWRAGVRRRVGWSRDGRGWLLTDSLVPPRERGGAPLGPPWIARRGRGRRFLPRPFSASCAELVAACGVFVGATRPRLAVAGDARSRTRERLRAGGVGPGERYAVAVVGARPGSAKGLPPERWTELLGALDAAGVGPFVLVAGPGEEASVRAVARPRRHAAWIDPVAGVGELAALASGAALFLTTDNGARHVAAAVGAPLVCVLGPTDPRHTADHLERTRLVRSVVPCGPCHRERCPLSGADEHRCLRGLALAPVVEAALATWSGQPGFACVTTVP